MKKLISILGALVLASGSAGSVIACGSTNTQHKNGDGNSIWAWLPGLNNGNKNPASPDVWNEMNPFNSGSDNPSNDPNQWDGATKGTIAVDILKMLNVSILANAQSIFESTADEPNSNVASYQGFAKLLEDDWTNLKASVDNQVSNQKESYKEQYGRNWEKKWNDMLKKDYDGSENNYRAYLFAEGKDDNATIELTQTLLSNNASTFETISSARCAEYLKEYNDASTPTAKTAWVTANPAQAREALLSATPYLDATQTPVGRSSLWDKDEKNTLSLNDVESGLLALKPDALAKLDVPMREYADGKYQDRKLVSTSSAGVVSNFQRFALNRWYSQEKPLAISEVSYAYKTAVDPTTGQKGLYNGLTDPSTFFDTTKIDDINNLLSFLNTTSSTSDVWSQLNSGQVGEITPTYESDFLNVDPGDGKTYNTNLSASVYGAIPQLTSTSAQTEIPPTLGTKDDPGLIQSIARDKGAKDESGTLDNGTMFKTFDIGNGTGAKDRVVAFFDDKGLNFIHVDGMQAFNSSTPKSADPQTPDQLTADQDNFRYNLSINGNEKLKAATPSTLIGTGINTFNTGIQNNYLQYLTNQSYINSAGIGSREKFNVFNAIKAYATLDSDTKTGNHLWYTWLYDFMSNYFTNISATKETNWLTKFIKFDPDSKTTGTNVAQWFQNTLTNVDSSLNTDPTVAFASAINKENQTIQTNGGASGSEYPQGFYWSGTVLTALNDILTGDQAKKLWMEDK